MQFIRWVAGAGLVPRRRSENRFGQSRPASPRNFTLGIIIYGLYTGINERWQIKSEKEYKSDLNPESIVFFFRGFYLYTIYAKYTTSPPCFICVLCILYTPLFCGGVSKIQRRRRSREMAQGCTQLTKWKTIRTVDSPQCNIIYHYRSYRYGNEHSFGRTTE